MTTRPRSLDPLFEPLTLGPLTLANRFVMAPMTRGFSPGGVPGPDVAHYYARRARSVGLIVTEGVIVDHPSAQGASSQGESLPVLHGEAALAGWRRVVAAVHAGGGLIAPQLWHMGPMREAGCPPIPPAPSCRPSGLWGPLDADSAIPADRRAILGVPGQPMRDREIADVIASFARSAANARDLGFDAIAIHGAHGYLIDSFLWDETNHRDDRYGGDIIRRTRFGADVVRAIRSAIGPGMPIIFRFSQWKQQDFNGRIARTADELGIILRLLVDAGVDCFDPSTRKFAAPAFEGSGLTLSGWTHRLSGLPTIAVGGIGLTNDLYSSLGGEAAAADPDLSGLLERFERGEFDLVALGRSLLADAEWPLSLREGKPLRPFDRALLTRLE